MSVNKWEHFFKPEVRCSGRSLVTQSKVSLSQPSDTEVLAYVRASTTFKVTFKCDSVESPVMAADCTCPLSRKGQFCKHIWATLLLIADKKPDFLESKIDLQKSTQAIAAPTSLKSKTSQTNIDSQAAYKVKQAAYRKEQYQKQKQRQKDIKKSKKNVSETSEYPSFVEAALKYFSENGFELRESMNIDDINLAKKKLARVFHPDVGGSHTEILELNEFADILLKFSKS